MELGSPLDYLAILGRIVTILPLALLLTLLVMGKRPVAEMPVFDLLVIIAMGAIVGADIADPTINHFFTAFALVVVAALQWGVSRARVRWRRFNQWVTFEPTVVIYQGRLIPAALKRLNYTLDDVLQQLREKGHFDLAAIDFALVEPGGRVSVLPQPIMSPPTRKDLGLPARRHLPIALVVEGRIVEENLAHAGLTADQLRHELRRQGYDRVSDVFFAQQDAGGAVWATPVNPPGGAPPLKH